MQEQEQQPVAAKPSIFVLGPSLDNVIEPVAVTVADVSVAGRRQVGFDAPPTSPGGTVNLKLLPPLNPGDVLPVNMYAFFVQPVDSVPAPADRTADWFFKSGAPSGSIHIGAADADGKFAVTVSGVKPSLQPYFVQVVIEFTGV